MFSLFPAFFFDRLLILALSMPVSLDISDSVFPVSSSVLAIIHNSGVALAFGFVLAIVNHPCNVATKATGL